MQPVQVILLMEIGKEWESAISKSCLKHYLQTKTQRRAT